MPQKALKDCQPQFEICCRLNPMLSKDINKLAHCDGPTIDKARKGDQVVWIKTFVLTTTKWKHGKADDYRGLEGNAAP